MYRAVTADYMKRLDRLAICKYGIPSIILMENAGREAADEVIKRIFLITRQGRKNPTVAIFCGRGNNGGDGMVCARYLYNKNINTKVYMVGDGYPIKGDPLVQLKIIKEFGIPVFEIKDRGGLSLMKRELNADIIVDAIFGIGLTKDIEGIYKDVIEPINRCPAYRLSIDIPSGLDATSGRIKGICIKADETVTMGLPKTGLYKNEGPSYAGKVKVVDIGLPKELAT